MSEARDRQIFKEIYQNAKAMILPAQDIASMGKPGLRIIRNTIKTLRKTEARMRMDYRNSEDIMKLHDKFQAESGRLESVYPEAVDAYAKLQLEPLLSKLALHKRLPRELREMVYTYIYGNQYIELDRRSWPSDYSRSDRTGDLTPDSAWLNPDFVGLDMAREGAEIYYQKYTFQLHDSQLKDLFQPQYDHGIDPTQYLRKLSVAVRYADITDSLQYGSENFFNVFRPYLERDKDKYISPTEELALYEERREGLYHILRLQRREQLEVFITLDTVITDSQVKFANHRRLFNILEMVREPVYELMHAGADICVRQFNERHDTFRDFIPTPRDPNHNIFKLTKEEWEKEKREQGAFRPSERYIFPANLKRPSGRVNKKKLWNLLEKRWGLDETTIDNYVYEDYGGYYDDYETQSSDSETAAFADLASNLDNDQYTEGGEDWDTFDDIY